MDHDEILWLPQRLPPADVCAHLLAVSVVEFSYSPNLTITSTSGMKLKPEEK